MAIYDSYVEGNRRTFISTNDLSSTGQFLFVKVDTAHLGQVVLATSATDAVIGVCMNAPKAGDLADVYLLSAAGTCKAYSAGNTVGDALTTGASSNLVTTTTTGNKILGFALWTASSGDLVEFLPANGFHL